MNAKGFVTTTSNTKDELVAKMREKTAAKQTNQNPPVISTSKFASTKTGFFKSHHNSSIGVQDPLGKTLKQQVSLMKKQLVQSPMDTYEISDREDSDTDDSDSEAENDKQKKRIPDWAQRKNLLEALEQQVNGRIDGRKVDPDDIFPEVQSCDLEAIFGSKKTKYRNRNSSGNWTRDKVTAAEKLAYKRQMGFATSPQESEI
jgi:hypothetical protein